MSHSPVDSFLSRVGRIHQLLFLAQLGLLGAGAWIAARAVRDLAEKYERIWGIAGGLALGVVLLILLVRTVLRFLQRTELRLAQQLDTRYALKDRLSTYVEIRRRDHPFLPALTADTGRMLQNISPWTAANPAQTVAPSILLASVLLAFLFVIPYLPTPHSVSSRKQDLQQVRQEAQHLEREIETLQKKNDLNPELRKLLSEALKEAREMRKPDVEKADALKHLNALENKLSQVRQQSLSEKQQQLTKSLADSQAGRPDGNADAATQEEMNQLSKDIQDALGTAAKDLQGSKEDATGARSTQISREQLESMQKALEQYRKESSESEQRMAEMQKALENARQGMAGGRHKVVTDSRIKDRDIERGKGGVEDGPGTTNKDVGPQHFSTKKQGASEYAEDKTKTGYEQIYKGERTEAADDPLLLGSKWNESGELRTQRVRSFGLDSQTTVAQQGDGLAAQDKAESEIRKEKIPASYQKMVKEYFESIQQH